MSFTFQVQILKFGTTLGDLLQRNGQDIVVAKNVLMKSLDLQTQKDFYSHLCIRSLFEDLILYLI